MKRGAGVRGCVGAGVLVLLASAAIAQSDQGDRMMQAVRSGSNRASTSHRFATWSGRSPSDAV